MQMTGTKLTHVPYKGQAPALVDLAAGRIQVVFTGLTGVKAMLEKGSVRALAVTQSHRLPSAPGIPSADEAGLPGYEFVTWYGFAAPRGTPAAVVNVLNRHLSAMLDDAAIQQSLTEGGMEPLKRSPEAFAALVKADYEKYGRLIREGGITGE
jgi:tripartite-type tricarboxylate transporter receptor subunit TctC